MKTLELVLGISFIVASVGLMKYWSRGAFLRGEQSEPFQIELFRNPTRFVVELAVALGLLAGGGIMIWLSSR